MYHDILKVRPLFTTECRFRHEFNVETHGRIPLRNTVVNWFNIGMFIATGNLQPSHGSGHYIHTTENIQRVRLRTNGDWDFRISDQVKKP